MRYEVTNRFTGEVQFTADIDCYDNAIASVKLGLAVRWGLKNGADLSGANLSGADLSCANLSDADLSDANLSCADLSDANLLGANLSCANLRLANLTDAYLRFADLSCADLLGANLSDANLIDANLSDADLSGANLIGANLSGAFGVNDYVKCIQIDTYPITYTADIIQIGCQRHTHQEWSDFSDAQIRAMDGTEALEWWRKYKDWLFQTIEMCPAKPTKG
jgi:uncharacterized protein YjbI with pentapeptide repeats